MLQPRYPDRVFASVSGCYSWSSYHRVQPATPTAIIAQSCIHPAVHELDVPRNMFTCNIGAEKHIDMR